PWRKHHVAFLVTHLGIITLLTGSLIGRIFGIEGTITLFKGDPPTNRLLIDEHQLRVHDSDGVLKGYRAEFLHRPPTPKHPRDLGKLASGGRLSVIDYAEAIDAKLNPRPLDGGGTPALHFTIKTAMMGQRLESWLLADDAQNGNFAMGLANIELKRGKSEIPRSVNPSPAATGSRDPEEVTGKVSQRDPSTAFGMTTSETDLDESIFVFAKTPDQITHVAKGGSTGAKISFSPPQDGDKGQLTISLAGKTQTLDVAQNLGKDVAIAGTQLTVRIENYWADLQLLVDRSLPHAEEWMDFTPAKNDSANQLPDGIRVRVEQNGETYEQWISAGWQITVPTLPNPIGVSYGWRSTPLPIALELLDFEVARNEGSDAPAGFKSTLRVSTAEGDSATGQCWMNHPFSFPGSWWRTWSGQTFKMSQASWNPENLGQSTI